MAAASHNTQAVLSTMSGDSRAVEQALNGSPQQRESYVQQAAQELGVSPRVLSDAIGGGSLESGTVMARAGQVAEAGTSGANVQLSRDQYRLAEGLQQGSTLMAAAHATYRAATHGGQDTQTLSYAAQGSPSHALASAAAVQSSQEVRSLGTSDAASVLQATSSVTHSGATAVGNYTIATPTAALHDASSTAQSTLRDVGVEPQAVVAGVRNGDATELNRAASTLGVAPDVVQGALMRGDSGDAITLVGAAGRHLIAQGPEAVQQAAQSQSGQLALHVAQSTPQNVLSQAMAGNDVAQAQIARTVSSDPQILASAAGNEASYRAVGSTLGDGAHSAVAASSTAQSLVQMHPNHALVERAMYGQGSDQQVAMQQLSRDMNVSPQVLSGALSGSSQDLSAIVAASSAGLHQTIGGGHATSPYFGNLAREAVGGQNPLATAINAAGEGQNLAAVNMAAHNSPGAQEAVRATLEANPQLSRLMHEGNRSASQILTAASNATYNQPTYSDGGGYSSIAQNLRSSDPVQGITAQHHQTDRGTVTAYDRFTSQGTSDGGVSHAESQTRSDDPTVSHQEHMPARYGENLQQPVGMAGTDAAARPQPPDSLSHQGAQPTQISDSRAAEPTGGWFDSGKRSNAPSGPKLSDATAGAAPVVPGSAQNRSLTPQSWQGTSGRERKGSDQENQARINALREQARRAREANNQAELEAIRRRLEQYGKNLDDE